MWRHEKLARQFKRNVATSAPFLFSAVPGFPRVLRAAVVFPFLWRKLHNDCIRTEADASSTTWFHIIFYRNSSKTSTHTFTYILLVANVKTMGRQAERCCDLIDPSLSVRVDWPSQPKRMWRKQWHAFNQRCLHISYSSQVYCV